MTPGEMIQNMVSEVHITQTKFMHDHLSKAIREISGFSGHDFQIVDMMSILGFGILSKVKFEGIREIKEFYITHSCGDEELFMIIEDHPIEMFVKICVRKPQWTQNSKEFFKEYENVKLS